jgi:hypothetical protein
MIDDPPTSAPQTLSQRVRATIRLRHLAPRTEEAYLGWIRRYHQANGGRDPARLGPDEVTAFLSGLATHGHVAASTQNQALAALVFLYRDVLGQELPWLDGLVRARRRHRLPVVPRVRRTTALPTAASADGHLAAYVLAPSVALPRGRARSVAAGALAT